MSIPRRISVCSRAEAADEADFVAGGGAPALGVVRVVVDRDGMLADGSGDDGLGAVLVRS